MPKRRALLIGVSAYGDLTGTAISAAGSLRAMQEKLEGKFDGLVIRSNLTKSQAETEIRELMAESQRDDVFMFYFAGHGTQVRDPASNPTQPEYCEGICPTDFSSTDARTVILDRELLEWTAKEGVATTLVFECCHSGGIAIGDPVVEQVQRQLIEHEAAVRPSDPVLARALLRGRVPAFLAAPDLRPPQGAAIRRFIQPPSKAAAAPLVVIAACESERRAYDDLFGYVWVGLFTHFFAESLTPRLDVSLARLLDETKNGIASHCAQGGEGCGQKPQLFVGSGAPSDFVAFST